MNGERATNRVVLEISGADRIKFLQGLITNDVAGAQGGMIYSALLTPQGKYLADFFVSERGDALLLDVDASLADGLKQRLNMYRLRADVAIDVSPLIVVRGVGDVPAGACADPRHRDLGWRLYSEKSPTEGAQIDWDAIRVAHCIPKSGVELIPNDTFILEAGFEQISGVDFKKGCYVGQEVTARMKHKTELRKGLAKVRVTGHAAVGTDIFASGKAAGTLFTQAQGAGIAYLRFDRAVGDMQAGDATVVYEKVGDTEAS